MIRDLRVELPGGIDMVVEADVLEHISAYRQKSCFRREAGGQLFARIRVGKWTIVKATGPRKSDWRSRFGYHPDRKAENEEIKRLFADGLHFVGDWHTHPQNVPRPSDTDIHSMNEAVAQSLHDLPGFLLFVVGTEPFPLGLWVPFHPREGAVVKLVPTLRTCR